MSRLTEKENDYYMQSKNCGSIFDLTEKLGQLEDIEKELGIDLITLFKLSQAKNVYAFGHSEIIQCALIGVNFKEIVVWNGITKTHYQLSSYGKSFALTKEELEK